MDQNGMLVPPPEIPPHIVHRMFSHRVLVTINVAIVCIIFFYLGYLFLLEGPKGDFDFRVEGGQSIQKVAGNLAEQGIVKHRLFFLVNYYLFGRHTPIKGGGYHLSNEMKIRDIVYVLEAGPTTRFVTIPAKASKEEIAKLVSDNLGWNDLDRQFFSHTYAGMQWQQYQDYIHDHFQKKYSWNDKKTQTFLTLSSLYYDAQYDFLKNMYIPGTYEIPLASSRAQVAGILIDQFVKENPDNNKALTKYIDDKSADTVAKLIDEQMILTPDIVALPPRDITLKKINGHTFLLFTTAYWNKGRGPLEFIADSSTKGVVGDLERNVFQRIYRLDGDYTEKLSGKFLWHNPHLHYHFKDFAVYSFEPVDLNDSSYKEILSQKSTFCIRDSEPIDLSHPSAVKDASYKVCGKERQGISPGWADSYYYSYVDQKFDVTDAPLGEYKLKIVINPLDRFEEITKDNNIGEVKVLLDVKNSNVKVLPDTNNNISNNKK